MPTIIHHTELVRRALAFLQQEYARRPATPLAHLLDETGMRFNLTPNDACVLEHLFRSGEKDAARNGTSGNDAPCQGPRTGH